MSRKATLELQPVVSRERGLNLGANAAHILLMAVEKQAWVDAYQRRIESLANKKRAGATLAARANRIAYSHLLMELDIQEGKLRGRRREADSVVESHPLVRLSNLQDDNAATEGLLNQVDLSAATVSLKLNNSMEVVQFATPLPIPDGLKQSYFGHGLTVDFEVLALRPERNWVFQW